MIAALNGSNYGLQMAANRPNLFKKADQDNDGKVTKEEMSATMPQNGKGPSVDDIFSKIDTNQDGAIDEAENEAALEQMKEARRNGPPKPAEMAKKMFEDADTDTDGKLTQAELKAVMPQDGKGPSVEELFKNADEDEDGFITESELATSMEKHHEEMEARKSSAQSEDASAKIKSLIEQLQKHEGYDENGTTTQNLLQNLFSTTA